MKIWWGALAGALLFTAACDALRYPGDGSDEEYRAETPPGAPGPAPPSEPVTDPYGDDEAGEVETPAGEPDGETVTPSGPDTAPDLPETPDTSKTLKISSCSHCRSRPSLLHCWTKLPQ